ncbi:unnamed protein product [Anisakis simplex]|uniref:Ovule protein n=1 Tax=Anisakis simplex TaxID=6269 RepID=A0A0M3JU58_ANISI|nr:unnamed protein product [Anisakis simplex]
MEEDIYRVVSDGASSMVNACKDDVDEIVVDLSNENNESEDVEGNDPAFCDDNLEVESEECDAPDNIIQL